MNPDLKLLETILTKLIEQGSNLNYDIDNDSIIVTGFIEGKTVKVKLDLIGSDIRMTISNNVLNSIEASIFVDNRVAISSITIPKDLYTHFNVLTKAVATQRDRMFNRQDAYNFLTDIAGKA